MRTILLALGLTASQVALAGQGQALIPHFVASTNSSCHLHVTNISQNDVEVQINFFEQNGNSYSPNLSTWYAFSGLNPITSKVTLGSKKTGAISLNNTSSQSVGFGYIKWLSEVEQDKALVADFHCQNQTNRHRSVLINGQMPF